MKTSKLILLFMVICLVISACASGIIVADQIIPTVTKQPEFTATNTVQVNTNTPTIPAETATPTEVPVVDTPTPTIVPTETLPVEWDIDPYIIEDIEGEYKGVTIKARLIIDKSLEDIVESVRINDDIYAEAIVKSFVYVIYQRKSNGDFYHIPSGEVDRLVKIWAEAQKTGSETYWRQVQLDNIWANDLNDGNGYSEKVYNFWPMYEGITPNDVLAMDKITIVFFDCSKSDIVNAPAVPGTEGWAARGASLDTKNFIFYVGNNIPFLVQKVAHSEGISLRSAIEFNLKVPAGFLANYLIVNDNKVDLDANAGTTFDVSDLLQKAIEYTLKIE